MAQIVDAWSAMATTINPAHLASQTQEHTVHLTLRKGLAMSLSTRTNEEWRFTRTMTGFASQASVGKQRLNSAWVHWQHA
jgi:hypothetical protein